MLAQYQAIECQRGRVRHLDVGKAAHLSGDLKAGQHRASVQCNKLSFADGGQ